MSIKGQTTSFAERVAIAELREAGRTDPQIAQALERPLATVRKWRRKYQREGRAGLSIHLGRPKTGPLGQFPRELVEAIRAMRQANPGWGPKTILLKLPKDPRFGGKKLPSRSRIGAFLKVERLVREYQRHQDLPEPEPESVVRSHQEWEIDAQGVISVAGLGNVSIINTLDVHSHTLVASLACLHKTHTNTLDHQVVLRRAFCHFGLPETISLDHDSVFYDNRCPSPFPTLLHLWLIGLGIEVRFIHRRPPAEHARIERAHQTVTQQAVAGKTFQDLAELQNQLDAHLHFLNCEYPCRSLGNQSPLGAFPEACTSSRPYKPEWEKELLDMNRVCAYLTKGRWFRRTSPQGMFCLGNRRYNARTRFALQTLEITYAPQTGELICLGESESATFRLPAKGLAKEDLLGELDPLISFPVYQLMLPFTPQAWRQLALCQLITDTT
jgi:transposase-like protein